MHFNNEEEDYNVSLSKFEKMLRTNKVLFFDSEEFEEIILHYLDTGKVSLAKKALKLALEQHPASTGLKLVEVEMLIYENRLEVAEKLLNQIHAIEPHNEEVYIQRANIFSKRDQHNEAVQQLLTALQYTDDYADVYSLLGMEYLFMDDFNNARSFFEKCLEHDAYDQSALYNVVYCYEFLEQLPACIAFLEGYIEKNPYSEVAWHQMGRIHYQLKDYENAFRAFDYACLIDEEFIGAYIERAKSLERLKRYQEAIESYEHTLSIDDPTSYALLRIGKCHEKLGNKAEAIKYYSQTVHEDPLLDKGWIAITDFYMRQKNYQKALFYVNKALSIDNENKYYWKRYATINRIMHFHEEAELGYRKAVEYGDYELDTWMFWADLVIFLGELESALEVLLQASEIFQDESEVEYRLSGVYFMLLEDDKGSFHLHNALRISFNQYQLLEEIFPAVVSRKKVKDILKKHSKGK